MPRTCRACVRDREPFPPSVKPIDPSLVGTLVAGLEMIEELVPQTVEEAWGGNCALRVPGVVHQEHDLSLIHISEPTRLLSISYAVFCLKKKKKRIENSDNA
eukprot:TRINITY_DN1929_c0_g2_i1.p1 TRINITY_DN1929_c0_g2~~TRINITY_DN1929_c0_g2_i1.p1  ORF type:complete len:102 (+),score=20.44 TRINITY_DN1929_c0_g2_i1:221-526(+)